MAQAGLSTGSRSHLLPAVTAPVSHAQLRCQRSRVASGPDPDAAFLRCSCVSGI